MVNNMVGENKVTIDLSEFGCPKNHAVLVWTLMDTKKAAMFSI